MNWKIATAAISASLALGLGAAMAQTDNVAVLGAKDTVAARKAAFTLSGATMNSIKAAVEAKAEPKTMAYAARGLSRWARTLPAMFPEGTSIEGSEAKPEVWSDRAGFEAAAAEYVTATGALAAAAQANDPAQFATSFAAVGKACQSCHDKYRVEHKR